MKFDLIDSVLEQSDEHIVALKQVSLAEEYLADHFPTFPVLPGVMMVELMVQAARHHKKAVQVGTQRRSGERVREAISRLHDGVIGRRAKEVVEHLRMDIPTRWEIAKGELRLSGAVFEIDPATKRCLGVRRLNVDVE